jgi:hypothetical protein
MSANATDVNFGISGLQLSANYSETEEKLSKEKITTSFLSALYCVNKVELTLTEEDINGNRILYTRPAFTNAVKKALSFSNSSPTTAYKQLMEILTKFGFYVATEVKVGGKLFFENKEAIGSWGEALLKKEEFGAGLEASLKVENIPISGSTTVTTGNSNEKNDMLLKKYQTLQRNGVGGNPYLISEPNKWLTSLKSFETWRIIEYKKLKPSLYFLPGFLGEECARLILEYPNNEPLTSGVDEILDLEQYARIVMDSGLTRLQPNPGSRQPDGVSGSLSSQFSTPYRPDPYGHRAWR